MVIGDLLAEWLAYGLEETFADAPEVGIVRKIRPYSGLVRYDVKADSPDWSQAVKDMLATEKPAAIVSCSASTTACRCARLFRRHAGGRDPARARAGRDACGPGRAPTAADTPAPRTPSSLRPPRTMYNSGRLAGFMSFIPTGGASFIQSASTT